MIAARNRSVNPLPLERGEYVIKIADSRREISQALRLRYAVFYHEYRGSLIPWGIDRDSFDARASHLVVLHKPTQKVVGTYRLIPEVASEIFYSETEFKMDAIRALPGKKLEIGRACVHKKHRNGSTLGLLWQGLMAYVRAEEVQYVLGCSSIQITSPLDLTNVHAYLAASGALSQELPAEPLKDYVMPELERIKELAANADPVILEGGKERLPGLVATYLKAGAKLYGMPAYDRHFACADYLSVLDVTRMTPAYQRRYGRSSAPETESSASR